jgi:hypothetical protein
MAQKSKNSFSIISSVPQALRFDDTDLKANRAGVLSERQRRRMGSQRNLIGVVVAICGAALVLVLVAGLALIITRNNTKGLMDIIMIAGVTCAALLGVSGFNYLRMHKDTSDDIVYNASGVVRRHKEVHRKNRSDSSETFYIYLDDLPFRFKVDDDVYDAFANRGLRGGYYTLYYLPRSKTILSAEPLETPVIVDNNSPQT